MQTCRFFLLTIVLAAVLVFNAEGQSTASKLEGMWSDPPATATATLCFFSCTDAGLDRLNKLLDDPANDSRPTMQLLGDAAKVQADQIRALFTTEALKHSPLDPLKDPGYLQCEPW